MNDHSVKLWQQYGKDNIEGLAKLYACPCRACTRRRRICTNIYRASKWNRNESVAWRQHPDLLKML